MRSVARWMGLALAVTLLVGSSRARVSEWLEPVRTEIPEWTSAALGVTELSTDTWTLEVDPQVLRAADLLIPDDAQLASDDRWWFPAEVAKNGRRYSVRAQSLSHESGEQGLRVRFAPGARPDGLENIEFIVADPQRDGTEWLAREIAREVGLIAPPTGFGRLAVNGGEPQLVYWREAASAAMLQRLGYPKSDLFRASAKLRRGPKSSQLPAHYVSALDDTPARTHTEALERLVSLVEASKADALAPEELAEFERSFARVINVDKLLAWEAITRLFGVPDAGAIASDWYFDPITGLLEPVFSSIEPLVGTTESYVSEAGAAAHVLLASPARLAKRDALLRNWAGTTQSLLLADADQRLGSIAASVAAGSSWYSRTRDLAALAQLRRGTREKLRDNAAALRNDFATQGLTHASEGARPNNAAPDAEANALAEQWVAQSGLPFEIEGEWLRLPAGSHLITRTLVVPGSHRLRLDAGAHLVMAPDTSIITFRGVKAIGTRHAPISIRALDPEDAWGAVGVARAPETSEFAYVTIEGGSDANYAGIEFTGQLSLNGSDLIVRDCDVLHGSGDDSVSIKRGSFQVSRSRFIDNKYDGFDAEWSTGSVEQSLFASNGDDGLDLGASEVRVHRTWFRRMGDKALSAGERSRVSVTDSQIVDSQIAIASKEDSRVDVRRTEFRRNEIGFSLYRDKAVFGSGYGVITGGLFSENLLDFAVETGSGLTLNGVERRATEDSGIVVGLHNTPLPTLSTLSTVQ